jgi:Holliday junction resolvase RusA-like endonuclease
MNTVHHLRIFGEPMQWRAPSPTVLTDRYGNIVPNRKTGSKFIIKDYSDTRVDNWIALITDQLADARFDGKFTEEILEGAIRMDLWIYRTRPKTNKEMYPDTRPDRTNFLKSSEDGLSNIPFDDGQVVDGEPHLRWAYYHYPDDPQTEQVPGIIFEIQQIDSSRRKELNKRYREYLKREGLKYETIYVGRKNKKQIVLRKAV